MVNIWGPVSVSAADQGNAILDNGPELGIPANYCKVAEQTLGDSFNHVAAALLLSSATADIGRQVQPPVHDES